MAGRLLESAEFTPSKLILPQSGDFADMGETPSLYIPEDPPLMQFDSETMDLAYHILWTAQSESFTAVAQAKEMAVRIPVSVGVAEDYFFSPEWEQQNNGTGDNYY